MLYWECDIKWLAKAKVQPHACCLPKEKKEKTYEFPPSWNLTQGHFIVRNHTQIRIHAWLIQKMIDSISIPLSWNLRCLTMNPSLTNRYSLKERPLGTKRSLSIHLPSKVIYEGSHAQIKILVWWIQKMFDPISIPLSAYLRCLVMNNIPDKQVQPERKAPWNQMIIIHSPTQEGAWQVENSDRKF